MGLWVVGKLARDPDSALPLCMRWFADVLKALCLIIFEVLVEQGCFT